MHLPSFTMAKYWVAEYKRVRSSFINDERYGRPKTVTNDEMICVRHQTLMENRRLTVKVVANTYGILCKWVQKVLHQDLDMKKHSLSRLLKSTIGAYGWTCKCLIVRLNQKNQAEFLRRTITACR